MSISAYPLFPFPSRSISSLLNRSIPTPIPPFTTFWFKNTISPANLLPGLPQNYLASRTLKNSIRCSFLKSSGFSIPHLQKIIKYRPSFLCFSLDRNIKPKIKTFQEEGFSSADISTIISCYPKILEMSLNNNIVPSFALIHDLLGSNAAVVTAVRKSPGLLTSNLKKTLEPNLEFLMRNGVSADRIRVVFNPGYPHIFICKPEVMRGAVEKIIEMGLNVSSKAFIYGILTFVYVKNKGLKLRLEALKDVGFSESDIMSMFRKEPRVFVVSAEKLKKVAEGLVGTGKFGISSIVHLPVALFCSFEKRYKPRITILRILESRNLVEDWPPLYVLSMATEAKFAERFVRPYINEIRDALMEKIKAKHFAPLI